MRNLLAACLTAAVFLSVPAAARAQPKDRLSIDKVRVGFPESRNRGNRYKVGAWAPVYVDLTVGANDIVPPEVAVLLVETTDSDGVKNVYSQKLPPLQKGQVVSGLITYVRPGNATADVTVNVRIGDRTLKPFKVEDKEPFDIVNSDNILYVMLGSQLSSLRQALLPPQGQQGQAGAVGGMQGGAGGGPGLPPQPGLGPDQQPQPVAEDPDDSRQRRFAFLESVDQMPTRWFGYQSADVVLLPTGSEEFLRELLRPRAASRRQALAGWVRRGGKLVVAAGKNRQFVNQLLSDMRLLNCDTTGTIMRARLGGLEDWVGTPAAFRGRPEIELTRLTPGPGVDVLVSQKPDDKDKESRPVVVEAACGVGRVIVVAFDLDEQPFTTWGGRTNFWKKLQSMLEPRVPDQPIQFAFGMQTNSNELAAQMQEKLESFGEVAVISFGWVALLILVYIIVVGPLDYLFLKKVVKRLELTWVTFPVIVLVVSAAAYFTAYALKGDDLRINKLDVVDIDLYPPAGGDKALPQVYGTSWFTLFSPRIQYYTVGVEPAWGGAPPEDDAHSTLVGWMGRPDDSFGGAGKAGSLRLFRDAYDYAEDASGLEGVPLQVWATKSFSASWAVPMPPDAPLFSAELRHAPGNPNLLTGTLTNRLPVELEDVVLIYRQQYYPLSRLAPGQQLRIDGQDIGAKGKPISDWFMGQFFGPAVGAASVPDSTTALAKPLLFHRSADSNISKRNTGLRELDQSWRLGAAPSRQEEVILVGRVAPNLGEGPAEKVISADVAPSRLWLGELPGRGKPRPELKGTLAQRTYVRVFIPVIP